VIKGFHFSRHVQLDLDMIERAHFGIFAQNKR
jgi:hypothetical protein